jgi:hypothetical protein
MRSDCRAGFWHTATSAETGDELPSSIHPETEGWVAMPDGGWRGSLCRTAPVAASLTDDEPGGDISANEVVWTDRSIIALAEHGRR